MNHEQIKNKLSLVPKKPGCYQMKNKDGEIIYVGKAKVLQNRLKSYFMGSHDAKTTKMVSEIDDFEYIITSSELEAFLLELNFIKENRPHYNILLMDDKSYPYICLTNEEYPRLIVIRDLNKSRIRKMGKLFGPYPSAKTAHNIVEMLNKIYPLKKCNNLPKKECLYYSLKQCLGPCINKIDVSAYEDIKTNIVRFLNGDDTEFIKTLENNMMEASTNLEFEKAIEYREMLNAIKILDDDQKMTLNDGINRDVFGYYIKNDIICIQVFHMRKGSIIKRSGEVFDLTDSVSEIMVSYISQFYDLSYNIKPQEILIPYIDNLDLLKEHLKVKVMIPIKGLKKKLIDLVTTNAQENLERLYKERLQKISKTTDTLETLSKLLNIPYPKFIEVFDNSNIQGTSSVSAMVCYIDGNPSYKDYRKYKVKTVVGSDDFHTMEEVITRRYSRVIKDNLRKPNLIIVDGGIPQVKAAQLALKKLKIKDIYIIGLAKDDKHRTRAIIDSNLQEIPMDKKSNLFLLMEAMQEEVHRFAITFFTKVHTESALSSKLDEIKGIGKSRKKLLLENFTDLNEIKNTSEQKFKALGFPDAIIKNIKENL